MAEKSITQDALQKLDSQLECSLCLDTYKQPKLLPCFHVFCKSPCLEKLVSKDGQSLQCPTCRHLVQLPAKGVTGLQSDFHIDRLFEIRDAFNKASKSTEMQCGNCEGKKAVGYCQDCEQFICDDCQTAHKTLKITKSHQIVTIDKVHTQAINLVPPKKTITRCSKHSNKKLKIYCETCRELICSDCTIRLHNGHNYDLVTDVFPKHKEEIVSSLKPVKEKLCQVQQALQAFDATAKEMNKQRDTVEANIHRELDQQIQLLNQQRVVLVGQLDLLTQQSLKTLAAQRDQVEIAQVKLTSCLEYAEGGLTTGTEGEVLAMKSPVLKRIEEIIVEFDSAIIQPALKDDIRLLTDGKQQLQKSIQECYEITGGTTVSADNCLVTGDGLVGAEVNKKATIELQTRTKDNKSYNGRVGVTAEITHCESQTNTKCKVYNKEDKHRISYKPANRGKHELHIAVNGKQVKGSPFPFTAAPSPQLLGKPIRVISDLKQPWGITTNSKGHYIVTEYEGHQITVFDSDFQKKYSFSSNGSGNGQLNRPRGVAVDNDDNIYVCDQHNHRVQKFTADGKFLSTVGTVGVGNLQFNLPGGIGYNKANGKLYVCDQSNNKVQVLNTDLTFYNTFGSTGYGEGALRTPVGVSFDAVGNVYIAEYSNNRVQVFMPDGEFLRTLGSGQLQGPLHVAITSTGTMYVTEEIANRISVYTPRGEFIRSFGDKGPGEGQFNLPVIVITDSKANVIVTDMCNNRVQFL